MKIGFTASSFDLLHAGHIAMLRESREHCDHLVVGLNVNPEGKKSMQTIVERYTQLAAVRWVDEIVPYGSEEELVDLIQLYRVDIRFIGEDYRDKPFTGDQLENIEIFYNRRDHRFSSSGLKAHVKENYESPKI